MKNDATLKKERHILSREYKFGHASSSGVFNQNKSDDLSKRFQTRSVQRPLSTRMDSERLWLCAGLKKIRPVKSIDAPSFHRLISTRQSSRRLEFLQSMRSKVLIPRRSPGKQDKAKREYA